MVRAAVLRATAPPHHGCYLRAERLCLPWVRAEGNKVPCVNNTQTWAGYWYPGIITPHPTGTEDYSIRGKFKGARSNMYD